MITPIARALGGLAVPARRDSNDGKKAYLGRRRLKENAVDALRDSLQFSVKIIGRDLSSLVKLPGSSASDSQRLELAERVSARTEAGFNVSCLGPVNLDQEE